MGVATQLESSLLLQPPIWTCLHLAKVTRSTIRLEWASPNAPPIGRGSGVVIGANTIAVPLHCSEGLDWLKVQTASGDRLDVSGIVKSLPLLDVCLLRVPGVREPHIEEVVEWSDVSAGDVVYVHSPNEGEQALCVRSHVVSPCQITVQGLRLAIDAPGSPGWSGRPVFTSSGQFIGLVIAGSPDLGMKVSPVAAWRAELNEATVDKADVMPLPRQSERFRALHNRTVEGNAADQLQAAIEMADLLPNGVAVASAARRLRSEPIEFLRVMSDLTERHPDSYVVKFHQAVAIWYSGDRHKSADVLWGLRHTPASPAALTLLVEGRTFRSRLEAVRAIQELENAAPECPCTWLAAARAYESLDLPLAALRALRELTALDPRDARHWKERARLARLCGESLEAAECERASVLSGAQRTEIRELMHQETPSPK